MITWVDYEDPHWHEQYTHYRGLDPTPGKRDDIWGFRDFGTLRYLLRGIETHLPWIRRVHLVTADQTPAWLNVECQRLQLVSHRQIFPSKRFLPTFNSAAIECCLANIPDLSETFIYFNDDYAVLRPTGAEYFFRDGLPVEHCNLDYFVYNNLDFSMLCHYGNTVLNNPKVFNKRAFIFTHWRKILNWRYGWKSVLRNFCMLSSSALPFVYRHGPAPLTRSSFQIAEQRYPNELLSTRQSRFRHQQNLIPYFFRGIHILEGNFSPGVSRDFQMIQMSTLKKLNYKLKKADEANCRFLCLNDGDDIDQAAFPVLQQRVLEYLQDKLPHASSFEKR